MFAVVIDSTDGILPKTSTPSSCSTEQLSNEFKEQPGSVQSHFQEHFSWSRASQSMRTYKVNEQKNEQPALISVGITKISLLSGKGAFL